MRFPQSIIHRKTEVKIYGKSESNPFYRISYRANGKRCMTAFGTYSEAKEEAEKKAREISRGSQILTLTPKEVTNTLAVREALEAFRRDTGRRITALQAVTQYLEVSKQLGERPLGEAIEGYLRTVAVVHRKPLSEAVNEFVDGRAPKAVAKQGKRSALNPKYVENTASWLREFSGTFPGHDVNDLAKDHLNAYIAAYAKLSPKSRNDRRAVVKQFLKWCVRKDYLTPSHRLFETDGLVTEASDTAQIDYYRPAELRKLLENATEQMRIVIALQGLAGLRLHETLRLDWKDVLGTPGHIEVSTSKSKTRQRRFFKACPALEQWLAPYAGMEGRVTKQWTTLNAYVRTFMKFRNSLQIPSRRNGLRHAFVTFHFALHQNENMTAALAGSSPAMIHAHYKGLATKAEAERWFAVNPEAPTNVLTLPIAQH